MKVGSIKNLLRTSVSLPTVSDDSTCSRQYDWKYNALGLSIVIRQKWIVFGMDTMNHQICRHHNSNVRKHEVLVQLQVQAIAIVRPMITWCRWIKIDSPKTFTFLHRLSSILRFTGQFPSCFPRDKHRNPGDIYSLPKFAPYSALPTSPILS